MQNFYINQHSLNPPLRLELVKDGKYDYKKNDIYTNAIQNANITFSMKNAETGILKVSKAKARVVYSANTSCEPKLIIEYQWKKRDVNEKGTYNGWIEINFLDGITQDGVEYPTGNLIVPIEDKLQIHIL